ncbi:MAG: sirohydrochlorin chelatase [Candidatus Promineifilaceae bacterium]
MKTATLLIGHGSRNKAATVEFYALAASLSERLGQRVEACFLEFADPPIIEGIQRCVADGATHIVALPLFLGPAGHQKNDVPAVINFARAEWPTVTFSYGTPLGAQFHLAKVLGERADMALGASDVGAEQTAVVVVGRGSRDPDSNSEVSKVARLVYEGRDYGWVEHAYFSLTTPRVADIVAKCKAMGAQQVILLPYLLFTGRIYERMIEQSAEASQHNEIAVLMTPYLFPHVGVVDAVLRRYEEAVSGNAKMTCDLCKYRNKFVGFEAEFGLPQTSDASHGLRGIAEMNALNAHGIESKMDEMLPPRYQDGGGEVSAEPMIAADLQFNEQGDVAWNNIWEDFCDLALAGGASHRETLLEPPTPDEVRNNPEKMATVSAEIERGIRMVTNLDVVPSQSLGWIGMRCHSDEMAIWLIRAMIVENVLVRREGTILFLPAGPHFTLQGEIKNVVTVVAKTFHYWTEHMAWKIGKASA